jgi:hypothetical protein
VLRQSATLMLVMLAAIAIEAGIKSWTNNDTNATITADRRAVFIIVVSLHSLKIGYEKKQMKCLNDFICFYIYELQSMVTFIC